MKNLTQSSQQLQKSHFMSKMQKVIFPAFSNNFRTRFPKESLFAPKGALVWYSKGTFMKTKMLHLSALTSENLAKGGVITGDPVLRNTWQAAGQNKL